MVVLNACSSLSQPSTEKTARTRSRPNVPEQHADIQQGAQTREIKIELQDRLHDKSELSVYGRAQTQI